MFESVQYPSKQDMADRLASQIADRLDAAIGQRGRALLAVSGGSTPTLLLGALQKSDLDWARVSVTLTDERCVPDTDERSNARFVRELLLLGDAMASSFLPLFGERNLAEAAAVLSSPLDVAVFGMGEDFHTASLFPDAKETAAALAPDCESPLALIRPPSQREERISLTAPPILACRDKVLILHGGAKKAALLEARRIADPQRAPVNILFAGDNPAEVHMAP